MTYVRIDGRGDFMPYTAPVQFNNNGEHSVEAKAVDKAGNVEPYKTAAFQIIASPSSSTITLNRSTSSVKLPTPFVLSGVLNPGVLDDPGVVEVKKPGSARWSYSSARLAYSVSAGGASWWYRYSPKVKGTYSFRARFAGDATRLPSVSRTLTVLVR